MIGSAAALLAATTQIAAAPLTAEQAMARFRATIDTDRVTGRCTRKPGEITVCANPDRRSLYRLPLPNDQPPAHPAGEAARHGIGDSPARIAPGFGLTLTVPIGKTPNQTAPGKATIQGTADALDR